MPRNRVRKSSIGLHTAEQMQDALDSIKNEKRSIRSAAKLKGIPFTTLRRYYEKSKNAECAVRLTPNYEVRKIFSSEQELTLEEYIKTCSQMFYGLTLLEIRQLAYEMAIVNKIDVPRKWHETKLAGIDWLYNFRKRHPSLSLRTPEGCSLSRATSFNRHNVDVFYKNLKNVMLRNPTFGDGTRVYNLDETSTSTVQKSQKVLGVKGQKQVSKVTSGEKGTMVTTCCIISAAGNTLPPIMIFPRVHFKQHMTNGAPAGTLGLAAPSGWMNTDLFVKTMEHFVKHTNSSNETPTLLIMDNFEAHISINVLNFAKDNGVTILTIPPHTSGKIQPLDVGLFKPFKMAYNAAIDSWMMKNPGKPITIYEIAACVGLAHMKAMTPTNICSAFRKTGIFPYDDNVFTDLDFLPAEVTNRPMVVERIEIGPSSPIVIAENSFQSEQLETIPIPVSLKLQPETISTSSTVSSEDLIGNHYPETSTATKQTTTRITFAPKSGSSNVFVSPEEFRGLPGAAPRKGTRPRRKGKSIIATDSPEKMEIEQRAAERSRKNVKSQKRKILQNSKGEEYPQETARKDARTKKTKIPEEDDESTDDDFSVYSDDNIISTDDENDENMIYSKSLSSLTSLPDEGQYVLVEFASKTRKIYYIGKVLQVLLEENEVDISFLRKTVNNSFRMPNVPDISSVPYDHIKYILPPPRLSGNTKRQVIIYVRH